MLTIRNATLWPVSTLRHVFASGQPALVVIVKCSWVWDAGDKLRPAARQIPIFEHDVPWPDGSTTTVRFESDRVPFKPATDVLVIGDAYAPGGRPVRQLDAGIRIGDLEYRIRVHGDRRWRLATDDLPAIGPAAEFTRMPLRHELAFGGIDIGEVFAENPVGCGLVSAAGRGGCEGRRLPNLEDPADPVVDWKSRPRPVATGCRSRTARSRLAQVGRILGEPDEAWRRSAVGLPPGFDYRVFNAADPSLQVPGWLRGDEWVELVNLTPEGRTRFRLPAAAPVVKATVQSSSHASIPAHLPSGPEGIPMRLDTVTIVAEHRSALLTYRGAVRLPDAIEDTAIRLDVTTGERPHHPVPSHPASPAAPSRVAQSMATPRPIEPDANHRRLNPCRAGHDRHPGPDHVQHPYSRQTRTPWR